MKRFIGTAIVFLMSIGSMAQIEVDEYPIQVKVDVERADELAPVTTKSSCGEVQVEIKEQIFSGGCLGTLVRTYVFKDDCGNTAQAEQYISLQDDQPPQFSAFQAEEPGIDKLPVVSASDNSGYKVEIEMTESKADGMLTRTWVATDRCGNENRFSQSFSLETGELMSKK